MGFGLTRLNQSVWQFELLGWERSWDLLLSSFCVFLFLFLFVFLILYNMYTYVWYEPAVLYQEFIFSLIHAIYICQVYVGAMGL